MRQSQRQTTDFILKAEKQKGVAYRELLATLYHGYHNPPSLFVQIAYASAVDGASGRSASLAMNGRSGQSGRSTV